MNYIKQKHTQILWLSFLILSIFFILYPEIDIQISKLFFNGNFFLKDSWWVKLLYNSVKIFLLTSTITVIILWLINKKNKKNILSITGKKVIFLMLVLILGSGIIVNTLLKENFGRARPRDIVEFEGNKIFTPVFFISQECETNCSLSSGHGSGAFFALALAFLFKYRKSALLIAFVYGSLVSLARIAAGAHFFSDNVVSFFIMAIVTDLLYYYLVDT